MHPLKAENHTDLPLLRISSPEAKGNWDELLIHTPNAGFFHSYAWAKVLSEAYNYNPYYVYISDERCFQALIPVMDVSSFLTGRRGVGLPFSDFSPVLYISEDAFSNAWQTLLELADNLGWKSIEFRGEIPQKDNIAVWQWFYLHSLKLDKQVEPEKKYRPSTRRNISRAKKNGIKITISHNSESLLRFQKLNALTRKRHGLPPQPSKFFRAFHRNVLRQGKGTVFEAWVKDTCIAAAVFVNFGEQVIYKYGASKFSTRTLRPNDLIFDKAIHFFSEAGFGELHFGRTDPPHGGLRRYKMNFGCEEKIVRYYKYDLKSKKFLQSTSTKLAFAEKVFRRLPIPVLKLAGQLLYRHVG